MLVSWLHFRRLLIGSGAMGFLECAGSSFFGREPSFGWPAPVLSQLPRGVNVCGYLELTSEKYLLKNI